MSGTPQGARPPLLLAQEDHHRLELLAEHALDLQPELANALLAELARADVVATEALDDDVVAVGREVAFRDETTGQERVLRLVWPRDGDVDAGRVSVMTPVGAALIGLRCGQVIDWPLADGREHRLRVVAVRKD